MVRHWDEIVETAIERLPEDEQPTDFLCETKHVDGTDHALNRKARLDWLKGDVDGGCRILSNARCLSEGIDVPALDAVLFMNSRKSYVDIIQAVGRVMRKAPGKQYGYIVLPVAIPDGVDPADALDDNERFSTVWGVLRALRSHDDRLNAEINRIDLNKTLPDRIIFGGDGDGELTGQQMFLPIDIPPEAILPKIVEKCGDKKYWESWAKDVADIFGRIVGRVENLLENPENGALREWFDAFHAELKSSINDSITRSNAIDMMAQHILTKPVLMPFLRVTIFRLAILWQSHWITYGRILRSSDLKMKRGIWKGSMKASGHAPAVSTIVRDAKRCYRNSTKISLSPPCEKRRIDSVSSIHRLRWWTLSCTARRRYYGTSSGGASTMKVSMCWTPFTGTGTFLARLLQSELIQPDTLERKYREELHANELVLLAYYIAAVNIEEVFRGRRGEDSGYEPFNGIVLTDTFNLNKKAEQPTLFPKEWLPDNNERAERQQKLPIQIIVGNPPWSAGQQSATDDNPNVEYPELEQRVSETYIERSKSTLKRYLYDTYKLAIRWASDRIGGQGIIAFVTNASWIDGNSDTGIRACLAEEFSAVHVLHLRGNQRTQGEVSRREGGKIFGSGSRAPVAITLSSRTPTQHMTAVKSNTATLVIISHVSRNWRNYAR